MTIQLRKEEAMTLATAEVSQVLMQMAVANREEAQLALDKVDRAAGPVIKALEEQLQKLTEENSRIEKQLQRSLQEEASWDSAEFGEESNMNHQRTCLIQRVKDYKKSYLQNKSGLDNSLQYVSQQLAEFAKITGVPFNDVKKSWEEDHPGFFEMGKPFS